MVGAAAQALVNPLVASEQEEAVAADDTATDATAPASAAAPAAAPAPDAEPSPAAPAPAAAAPVVPSKPPAAEAPEEPSAAAAAAAPADGDWSEAQALALVKAMKQFGKELGAERWERVAELVPGKSKVQCFKRFKELKEQFKNKKAAVE
uniref:Myb-like domain-containing protein n=1 Tax=Chlamydomonas euryale TaxID=1486919 RepID=A0A7R9V3A6_9CHLO